jgi:hypothetical protein
VSLHLSCDVSRECVTARRRSFNRVVVAGSSEPARSRARGFLLQLRRWAPRPITILTFTFGAHVASHRAPHQPARKLARERRRTVNDDAARPYGRVVVYFTEPDAVEEQQLRAHDQIWIETSGLGSPNAHLTPHLPSRSITRPRSWPAAVNSYSLMFDRPLYAARERRHPPDDEDGRRATNARYRAAHAGSR